MVTLNVNDVVHVNGQNLKIVSIWASGAHKRFVMESGPEILDLDKLCDSGGAKLMGGTKKSLPPVDEHPYSVNPPREVQKIPIGIKSPLYKDLS